MLRRSPMMVLFLAVMVGLALFIPTAQLTLAGSNSPGTGWVAAGTIEGGCWDNGTCSSSVSAVVDGLFEYYPDAQYYRAGVGPAPKHGGFTTFVDRDICHQGTSYEKSAAGIWHHGATWSKIIRVVVVVDPDTGQRTRETTITWDGPKKEHWAFYHDYNCSDVPVPTNTPTIQAGGGSGGPGNPPSNPPGNPKVPTPTMPPPTFSVPESPTPQATVTPLPTLTPVLNPCVGELGENVPRGVIPINSGPLAGQNYSVQDSGNRTDYWPQDMPQPQIIAAGTEREVAWDLAGLDVTSDFRAKNRYAPSHDGQSYLKVGLRDMTTGVDLFLFDTENIHWSESGIPEYTLRSARAVFGPGVQNTSDALFANWDSNHSTWTPNSDTAIPRLHNNYLRNMGVMRVRFTPQPGHTYIAYGVGGFEACRVSYPRWSLLTMNTNAANVAIRKVAPSFAVVGTALTYKLEYTNTTAMAASNVEVIDQLPASLTYISANPAPSSVNGGALRWSLGSLAGHSSGTIYLNVQVAPNATGSVANTGRITTTTPGDDPDDNTSTTTTQIATPPKPEADIKLRIHSTFDPLRGIYTSDGAAVSWPAGETMDFTPYAALKPVPVGQPGLYRYKQRVVGWSLIAISGASVDLPDSLGRSGCRSRATPTEDVGTVQGCTYKYLLNPSPTDMRSQAHIFWSVKRPQSKPENTYVYVGQPLKSATLTIDVVIVTEIVDDQPGSPTYGVALYATTDTERGVFDVTLLVPRSTK